MALTKVGIIYSLAQLVRRELIKCADDSGYKAHIDRLLPGEGWFEIPIDVYNSFGNPHAIDDYLEASVGAALSDRCAVINGDNIVAVCCADPAIDRHPDGWIIQDDTAQAGWTYDFVNAVAIPDPVRLAAEAAEIAAYDLAHPVTP